MNTITSKNGKIFSVGNTLKIGIYPYPGIADESLRVLDLARGAELVEIHSGDESLKDTDAAVCDNRTLSLAIRTRDCAPICFSDGEKIAIAHIGWQGYALGLLEKTLAHFDPKEVTVYVGPFLHSFEIQKDFCYDALMQKAGAGEHIREDGGKIMFDFQNAIAALLPEHAVFDTRDTGADLSLPSHRRDKESKGFMTVVQFFQ